MYHIIYLDSNFFLSIFQLVLVEDLEDENPHTKKEYIKKELLSARKRTPKIMPQESSEMSDNIEHSANKNRTKSACSTDRDSVIDVENPEMVDSPEWLKKISLYKKISIAALIFLLFVVILMIALFLTAKDGK